MKYQNFKTKTSLLFDDEGTFARIGLLLLATDLTTEHDLTAMCRDSRIRLHVTRAPDANPVTPENLVNLGADLGTAAALLVPKTPLQALYYSCTSSSALLGQDRIEKLIQKVLPDVPVITPMSAALDACRALKVKSICVLTPYTEDVSIPVADHFSHHDIAVKKVSFMGLSDDRMMARLTTESIIRAAEETMEPGADALFISCTALRSALAAGSIEKRIGRPVITSNQAAAWRILRLTNMNLPGDQYGRLMTISKN